MAYELYRKPVHKQILYETYTHVYCRCIGVWMYGYGRMGVWAYGCMRVCVYVCICVCMRVCVCVCAYMCMHVCMRVCVYVCMCVCVYVCMCVWVYVFRAFNSARPMVSRLSGQYTPRDDSMAAYSGFWNRSSISLTSREVKNKKWI